MSTTNIFLIRHGQTQWNLEERLQGSQDSPLTEQGRKQAIEAANSLEALHLDHVYSSPLTRAYDTACLLIANRKLPVIISDALREIHLGPWEGLTRQEIYRDCPEDYQHFWARSPQYRALDAESFASVQARMADEIETIFMRHQGQNVLLVSHTMAIMCALDFYQVSMAAKQQEIGNCSIVKFQRTANHTDISFNRPSAALTH